MQVRTKHIGFELMMAASLSLILDKTTHAASTIISYRTVVVTRHRRERGGSQAACGRGNMISHDTILRWYSASYE